MRNALVCMLLLSSAGAVGQTPKSPAPRADDQSSRLICEVIEELGSRLKAHKVCMTRSQWREQRQSDKDLIDRSQLQMGQQPPNGG